jgi:hypothetical protein
VESSVDRRAMRKRGLLALPGAAGPTVTARPDVATARRLWRINALSATAFVLGGSLFALGPALSQVDVGGPRLSTPPWRWWSLEPGRLDWSSAVTLFVGTLFFGASLLVALVGRSGSPTGAP